MRDFVNDILATIGSTSLTDAEFATITETSQTYSPALYAQVMAVLTSRESVSSERERLTFYFKSRGASVDAPVARSNILIGLDLGDTRWN